MAVHNQVWVELTVDTVQEVDSEAIDPARVAELAQAVVMAAWHELSWLPKPPNEGGIDSDMRQLELTLTLTDDDGIRSLNRQYRLVDDSTDVLSFPQLSSEELQQLSHGGWPDQYPPQLPLLLGDIVLNLCEARQAAQRYGHSVRREMGFLIVHGFLHLVGFGHDTPDAEAEMKLLTEKALQRLGLTRMEH